jgi:ribosomal protein S27E
MSETLLNVTLALATHFFSRAMYVTCPKCRTLNARRRTRCRSCGESLPR